MFNNTENKSDYAAYFLSKIMDTIVENYYYDISYEDLYHAAIKGMFEILDDYSTYLQPQMKKINDTISDNLKKSEKSEQNTCSVYDYYFDELIPIEKHKLYRNTKLIKITEINRNTSSELGKKIELLKRQNICKVVIDLRDNIGGGVDQAVGICNQLVRHRILFKSYDKNKKCEVYQSNLVEKPFETIIVLTNRRTMSAAELIAFSLQEDGNIIIGEKTFGKGVSQISYKVYGGGMLKVTTKEYFGNKGDVINNVGVCPDIVIDSEKSNFEDEVLKAAFEYAINVSVK